MKNAYALFVILITILGACKKDRATPPQSLASFPISVGNTWSYKYTIYIGESDTLVVTVLSKIRNQGGDSVYLIQKKTSLLGTDTLYALVSKDSVTYYDDLALTSLSDKYLLPLNAGSKWSDKAHSIDTTKVLGIGQTNFNGIEYDSIISIRRDALDGADSVYVYLTFVKPGIGIVYQSESEYFGYYDGYSLCLLSYDLKN